MTTDYGTLSYTEHEYNELTGTQMWSTRNYYAENTTNWGGHLNANTNHLNQCDFGTFFQPNEVYDIPQGTQIDVNVEYKQGDTYCLTICAYVIHNWSADPGTGKGEGGWPAALQAQGFSASAPFTYAGISPWDGSNVSEQMKTYCKEFCSGVTETAATNLEFSTSMDVDNYLDQHVGGDLRYKEVGFVGGSAVDLLVMSSDYTNNDTQANGVDGDLGMIGMNVHVMDASFSRADLTFCLVETGTSNSIVADSFHW